MNTDFDNPEAWLENIEQRIDNTPRTHRDDPNFAERVAAGSEQLRREHQIVSSQAELRKQGAALTQTEVANDGDESNPRVSSLEADLTKIEVATLMDYVRAPRSPHHRRQPRLHRTTCLTTGEDHVKAKLNYDHICRLRVED